jgi:Tfp pilus assembly protein PilO
VLEPRKVDLIGRALFVLLLAGFAVLATRQTVRPLLAARQTMGGFREAVGILGDAEQTLDLLQREIDLVSQDIEKSQDRLPQSLSLDAFLVWLGGAAQRTGIRADNVTPGQVEEHSLYRQQRLAFRVTGSYSAIHRFLDELEGGDHLSRVDGLRIARSGDGRFCTAEIKLLLFFAPRRDG